MPVCVQGCGGGAGDAARERVWRELAAVQGANWLDVAAKLVETGAELEGSAKEKFGAHGIEVLLVQSAFDAAEAGREPLKLLFERREVFFLKLFELE